MLQAGRKHNTRKGRTVMLSKQAIIDRAHELDFQDVGFTTAEPFRMCK